MRRAAHLLVIRLLLVGVLAAAVADVVAQDGKGGGRGKVRRQGGGGPASAALPPAVASLKTLSVVAGRPSDRSVTLNVLAAEACAVQVEYEADGIAPVRTAATPLAAGQPAEITVEGLKPGTAYRYRIQRRPDGGTDAAVAAEGRFQTQRGPGQAFVFEVQGDSHPERRQQFDPALYAQTLRGAAGDRPDFYFCLGDDFSVDTLHEISAGTVDAVYRNQRLFLGLIGRDAPVFLVNGNHEQAARCNLDGTATNVAVLAQTARNRYFPQPAPDAFYSGNATPVAHVGLLRNYYAWTWGDALFVVIDPYWHSPVAVDNRLDGGPKTRDLWAITLGDEQYRWLKQTLEESQARYKFVFAHHVLGTGRGGIEMAGQFEWGGADKRGDGTFDAKRPGWTEPIHPLMVRTGVTIFFQGHDHVFARQVLDGVVYQSLPEPADPNYALNNREAYRSGDVLPSSGRLRIHVGPAQVKVEYVRSWLPKDVTAEHKDGEVAFSYVIHAGKTVP